MAKHIVRIMIPKGVTEVTIILEFEGVPRLKDLKEKSILDFPFSFEKPLKEIKFLSEEKPPLWEPDWLDKKSRF